MPAALAPSHGKPPPCNSAGFATNSARRRLFTHREIMRPTARHLPSAIPLFEAARLIGRTCKRVQTTHGRTGATHYYGRRPTEKSVYRITTAQGLNRWGQKKTPPPTITASQPNTGQKKKPPGAHRKKRPMGCHALTTLFSESGMDIPSK